MPKNNIGGKRASNILKIEQLKKERTRLKRSVSKRFDDYQRATGDTKKEKLNILAKAQKELSKIEDQIDKLKSKEWNEAVRNLKKVTR